MCLVTQSCPTLCEPMDCSPPDSSVNGILQAKILEWVAIPFSMESSRPRDQTRVLWTADGSFTVWATGTSSVPIFFFNYWFTPIDNGYLFNYYRFRYSVQLSFSMVSDSLQPRGQKLQIWLFNACFNKATCCLHLYSNIPLSSYPWDPSRLAITHSLCC